MAAHRARPLPLPRTGATPFLLEYPPPRRRRPAPGLCHQQARPPRSSLRPPEDRRPAAVSACWCVYLMPRSERGVRGPVRVGVRARTRPPVRFRTQLAAPPQAEATRGPTRTTRKEKGEDQMRQTAAPQPRPHRRTATAVSRTPRTTAAEKNIRILRQADVTRLTGLSRTTIWRRVQDGSFPPPIRLGPPSTRAKGWRQTDLQDWFDSLQPAA